MNYLHLIDLKSAVNLLLLAESEKHRQSPPMFMPI